MNLKKLSVLFIFSVFVLGNIFALDMEDAWKEAKKIEKSIKRTDFPNKKYLITDYGAVPDDSSVLNHDAINSAITDCSINGGGHVIIPDGVFYTGPITLKSNVDLHLEDGAVVKFVFDPKLYLPQVATRWEGNDCYNYHPLIYANGETNIAITGKGLLDGQGSNSTWWSMCGAPRYGWKKGMPGQNVTGRNRLMNAAESQLPMEDRIMGFKEALRPQFVNFYKCNTILIKDVTLLNSPFWVLHPLLSQNIVVKGVKIVNDGPNGDGCDPESCKNVLIEDCFFNTGDDCIAIKSGRNKDGRKWNIPSENIIVRNCKMANGHGGVVIGSEISGGYRNLFVENCDMDSPELERVIRIKTNTCRGGLIENVYVRNVKVGQCREAVLKINLNYESREECERGHDPTVRNVYLENVTCNKSRYGVLVSGLKGGENVYNINVANSHFNGVKSGNKISGAKNVNFSNLYINGKEVKK